MPTYLLRLHDGPSKGDFMVENMEWPLPAKLVFFPETGALVDADARDHAGNPIEWPDDLHLSFYGKVDESQLPDDIDDEPRIMRGAQYRVIEHG